ncbi:MAG: hypothetical protein CMK59_01395 [Proteobacteria bacterium]|nr:hypothetical protein [Pseudomonadota bacterium]
MSTTAFILAAGFGTRVRPLTLDRPKPLLPVLGVPMLNYALAMLRSAGHERILVNAHHLSDQIAQWANQHNLSIQIETPDILGTGGGLRKAMAEFADKILVWNGDIVSNIDIDNLYRKCESDGAAMALKYSDSLGKTTELVCEHELVVRIGSLFGADNAPALNNSNSGFHFTGIHAISKEAISLVPKDGLQCIVRTAYKELVPRLKVKSVIHKGHWKDTGTPIEYLEANLAALREEFPLPFTPPGKKLNTNWLAPNATIKGSAQDSIIGANSSVTEQTSLSECVVWDNIQTPKGHFHRCIFHDQGILQLGS